MRGAGRLAAVSLAAACCYGSGVARSAAQTAFTRGADILGIRLGDDIDAVRKTIAANFPGSQSYEVTTTLNAQNVKEDYKIGTLFDITSSDDQSANGKRTLDEQRAADARKAAGMSTGAPLGQRVASTGDYGRERLAVTWYSGAHGDASNVFGIGRSKAFLATARPLASDTEAALIEKYGKPALETAVSPYNPHKYLFWTTAPGSDRRKCFKEDSYPGLYEDSGFNSIETLPGNADTLRTYFLGDVNNFHSHNPLTDVSRCGVVLRAHLILSADLTYVSQLNENLVDLSGGQSALTKLGDGFFSEVTPPKPGPKPKL